MALQGCRGAGVGATIIHRSPTPQLTGSENFMRGGTCRKVRSPLQKFVGFFTGEP